MPTNSLKLKLLAAGIQSPAADYLADATVSLAKSGVPVIVAPNGTIATNGVVTLGTALPLIYTAAWVRFPAGAVVGGSAGLYYVVFSSTTVGQVYTNYVSGAAAFTPHIPATIVAAVGSNAAYTQVVATAFNLVNVSVPADTMGADGTLKVSVFASNNNSVGNKTIEAKLSTAVLLSTVVTTSLSLETEKRVTNRGVANKQVIHASENFGVVSAVAPTQSAINTADVQAITITGAIATATDYIVLERFAVEVKPA